MSTMKSNWQLKHSIVLLRILIGWHFLYEGITKMYDPDWTSFGYLASAQGPLKPFFTWLTSDALIGWVDTLNVVALILVGITLILGFLEKIGALAGIGLLALYYLAHPSLPWLPQINVEGSYWFVNKNLIELVACMILYQHPTGHVFGLGCFFKNNKRTAKIEKV